MAGLLTCTTPEWSQRARVELTEQSCAGSSVGTPLHQEICKDQHRPENHLVFEEGEVKSTMTIMQLMLKSVDERARRGQGSE